MTTSVRRCMPAIVAILCEHGRLSRSCFVVYGRPLSAALFLFPRLTRHPALMPLMFICGD